MKRCISIFLALLILTACGIGGQTPASGPSGSQGGGEVAYGGGSSPGIPSEEPSGGPVGESGPPQNAGETVIENIPQEEQQAYFKKYIEPYYLVGLMYQTWSDPEEIEVWRYMNFFTYNEYENYYNALEDPLDTSSLVPADIVEGYITSFFEVDPEYLRTAQNYHHIYKGYRWMENEGIGGGPGLAIERIEKDGELWKFVCRDISDNLLSVTIRMGDENSFRYVAGEGLEIPSEEPPTADDRLDGMALGVQARILTEHIVLSVFRGEDINNGDCPPSEEKDMLMFTLGTVFYRDREEYMYHGVGYQGEDRFFHFPEEGVKNMVYEVFGFEGWTPDKSITGENFRGDYSHPLAYNAQEKDFFGGLEFGFGNGMECRFMATLIDADGMRAELDYDLYTSSGFPNQSKIAAMTTNYAVRFREDDTPYLRYLGTVVSPIQDYGL